MIFQENVSFDHYFGTYPHAANLRGERPFAARAGTPSVNGFTPFLRFDNPNLANPIRLSPSQGEWNLWAPMGDQTFRSPRRVEG